ncbi:hypothetical protein ACTWJ8_40600 (plasmid) [Streptomyces sp. SDT5-1]|uniref:hypothetical protein n=1 Tax=Streptomyces sp. SDT5-1 TaxID=3406418 RepID=UPI003FD3F7DA
MSGRQTVLRDVREVLERAGLRQVWDVETWLCGDEVVLKVAVAPEERPGAAAIPGRVLRALRTGGMSLAAASAEVSAAPEGMPATEALGQGQAVRVC